MCVYLNIYKFPINMLYHKHTHTLSLSLSLIFRSNPLVLTSSWYLYCMCVCMCVCIYIYGYIQTDIYIQPIPLGVTFSKAQSSKLKAQRSNVSFATFHWKETFELWVLSFETAFENVTPSGIGCINIYI